MAAAPLQTVTEESVPLRIENLVRSFGELRAVDGISLDVAAGECLGLLGPNGAGKSTLLRSVAGRVAPDSGAIAIFGSPVGSSAARRMLGWIPQDLALYARLSCRENLEIFGRYQGVSASELKDSIAWGLKWAALEDSANTLANNLSGGMKRRLNMAAGLIHRPRLVLMDEPTVGVDPQSRNRIFEMIEQLRAEGMAIIYTTHYMEEAERLCDRIAIVDHGKVIASGTNEQLVDAAFGSRSQVSLRLAASDAQRAAAWVQSHGGLWENDLAEFTIAQSAEVADLLESLAAEGLELADISMRRPNLESVFLQLTGRGLRE